MVTTPAELRRDAEQLRKSADDLLRRAKILEDAADALEAHLTIERDSDTLQTQMQPESAAAGRSLAQFDEETKGHKFVQMLERRRIGVPDVAARLSLRLGRKVPRSSVQSWYKPTSDPAYRPIRMDAAQALKDEFGVPLNAWPRIVEPKGK